ncbi:hypothetical protein OK016_00010 [Vibrio chagasii]|nr:hypothetical protein [Vibrio chagasii]
MMTCIVTTVSLSADASVTEGENITYTATLTKPADGRRTLQWCNDHYRRWRASGTTTVPASR